MKIQFEIKSLPKTTNAGGRSHWTVKMAEARKWKSMTVAAVAGQKPKEPFVKAKVTLVRCSSKESDFDGLVSSFKHVMDGLVEARIIQDDRPSVIGSPTYLWEMAKPGAGRIRVTVEGIE